jgi:hypothetical protein
MKYYKINPEVPAGLGINSILERTPGHPLKVINLHLVFEGWLGGDLLETSPVFYVTERLKSGMEQTSLSGIQSFDDVEVSKSENFLELYPNKDLPKIFLLRINGRAYDDDFGIDKGVLVISETAKNFLAGYNLSNSDIEETQK